MPGFGASAKGGSCEPCLKREYSCSGRKESVHLHGLVVEVWSGVYLQEIIVVRLCFQVAAIFDRFLERGGLGCEGHGCVV